MKKVIKFLSLYKFLISDEHLNPISAYRCIQSVRELPVELKNAVSIILQGLVPEIEYHNVSYKDLKEHGDMGSIRAVLMLDWIRRETDMALRYMARERFRAPLQIKDQDKNLLEEALKRLKVQESDSPTRDESDIEYEL